MRAYATALLAAVPRLQHCAMREQPARNSVSRPLTLSSPRAQTSWTGFTVVTLVVVVMVVGAAYMVKEYRQALSEAGTQPKKKVSVKKTKREAMKRGMRGQN
jgi:DNA binding protein S1FA